MQFDLPFSSLPHLEAVNYSSFESIEARFKEFHRRNPHVYDILKSLSLQVRRNGRSKYAIASLVEVLRWSYSVQTKGADFKLSNDFRAFYARKLMRENPELAEFFALRPSVADQSEEGF